MIHNSISNKGTFARKGKSRDGAAASVIILDMDGRI